MKMLKPSMPMLRTGLATLQHSDAAQVPRLRGKGLQLMKRRLLARAGYLCECEQCAQGYPLKLTWSTCELDHTVQVADGGDNSVQNLRALHVDCHKRVTAEQAAVRASRRRGEG